MPKLHNIEKSVLRRGLYIGYANGVWHIRKGGQGWRAVKQTTNLPYQPMLEARTLVDLSQKRHAYVKG